MASPKTLNVPITGGIRQDLSEHMAPPGTLMDATNVRLSTQGEVESRPGTTALSAATDADVTLGDIWNGTGILGAVPGGFVVGSEGFAYRYDFAKARLHLAGSYGNAEPVGVMNVVAREELVTSATIYSPYPLSQAAKNGYVATVYSSGNGQDGYGPIALNSNIALHVFTESGALVMSSALGGTTTSAAFLTDDGSSASDMILVRQDSTTGLEAAVLATSATGATLGAFASVGTLSGAAFFWAACENPGLGWLLAYQSGAGTVSLKRFIGTVQQGATVTFAVTGTTPVSVYSDGTHVYVGWREGVGPGTATYRVYSAAALAVVTGATATTIVTAGTELGPMLFGPSIAAGEASFAVTEATGHAIQTTSLLHVGKATALGAVAYGRSQYQCVAASAPFGPGYIWVRAGGIDANTSGEFTRYMMLDFMDGRTASSSTTAIAVDAVIALTRDLFIGGPSSSYDAGWYKQHLSTPQQLSDGTWVMGIPREVRGEELVGLTIAEWLRFSTGGTRQTTPFADGLLTAGMPTLSRNNVGTRNYLIGGTLFDNPQSDGTDLGFPLPPAITASASNGAGSLVGGQYQMRAVLERIDGAGRRWRSAPSAIASVGVGGANDTMTVETRVNVNWLRATAFYAIDSRFVMHVYSTMPDGSTFYRATPPQGAPYGDALGGFVFTMLSVSDRTEILYTDGGVLNNDCPPPCRFVRTTEDRIWLGGLWEAEQLQSSKIIVPGEPPQFSDSPAFRVVLPEPCTGIAYQDGILVAFTRSAIYGIQGSGPNDQGQGAWDSPRNVTRSSGCVNELSIVETSIGIFYQSIRGIELLPRGLGEPQFVGMAVQGTLGSLPVQSASVVSTGKDRTVRFCYGATINGSVNVLVYDLDTQCWSRDIYPLSISGICDTEQGAVLATVDPDADAGYGFLLEGDSLATDQSNTNAYEITSSLEFAKVRPFGVAGFGKFVSAIGLFDTETPGYRSGNATITVVVDGQTEPGYTFNMNTLSGASYRKAVPRNFEGTAVKLTLSTNVAGWRFMGWTLELEEVGGGRRMPETEQG